MSTPQGLLFVLVRLGDEIPIEEFHDWYNNEHAPLRLGVKGFHSAVRYEAIDEREPKWLALYNVDGPEVLSSDGYKSLAPNASERERGLLPRLGMLNRRVYSLIATHGDPELASSKLPSKYVAFAAVGVKQEDENEFEQWCAEEHVDLITKVPGWIHTRRYKLTSAVELIANAEKTEPGVYLNLHFFDRPWDISLPEVRAVYGTPRTAQIMSKVTSRDFRQFVLYKDIGKPTWK